MELWFTENYGNNAIQIKVKEHLHQRQSRFQQIDVFETFEFGKMLVLDGYVMTTEYDEPAYHELLTHVPAQSCKNLKNVLIIGGGDGGTAREMLKYQEIESVHMVEIDEDVVHVSKEYFEIFQEAFQDSRLKLFFEDGAAFVKDKPNSYDLILVDSTDPIGPGKILISPEFYHDCSQALTPHGILAAQTESPYDKKYQKTITQIYQNLKTSFKNTNMYLGNIPTYPFCLWSFAFASQTALPTDGAKNLRPVPDGLKYYHKNLHEAIFQLPVFVQNLIK